jgi:hypothetical protein
MRSYRTKSFELFKILQHKSISTKKKLLNIVFFFTIMTKTTISNKHSKNYSKKLQFFQTNP